MFSSKQNTFSNEWKSVIRKYHLNEGRLLVMTKKALKRVIIILFFFTGIGAMAGGFGFIVDPSGKTLGMSTEILPSEVFFDFLIPGLFLFIVIGIGHILVTILFLISRSLGVWKYLFLMGFILGIWIIIQILMIGYLSVLQPIYLLVALVEMFLASKWHKAADNVMYVLK